jgi:hypothetical protein
MLLPILNYIFEYDLQHHLWLLKENGEFRWYRGRRIATVDPALCDPCMTRSRVGTHRSWT